MYASSYLLFLSFILRFAYKFLASLSNFCLLLHVVIGGPNNGRCNGEPSFEGCLSDLVILFVISYGIVMHCCSNLYPFSLRPVETPREYHPYG